MVKVKLGFVLAVSFFVSGGVFDTRLNVSTKNLTGDQCPTHMSSAECPMHSKGEYCPMHDNSDSSQEVEKVSHDMENMSQAQLPPLRPDGSRDTATHRWSPGDGCSRLNKNSTDKKLNGIKPNTVACACVKKCVEGQVQEDMSKDKDQVYICKNACHKDRCFCPNPCKS